jgi:uncharacterized membrane protein
MDLKLAIPLLLHQLASIVWIGGMFFSHFFLRPVLKDSLEPPARIQLALGVFRRFFPWVWVCVATLWVSGGWITIIHYRGMVGSHVLAMMATALVMTLVFAYVFAVPYRKMRIAVEAQNWRGANAKFSKIRALVALNLALGLATVAIATAGPAVLLDIGILLDR